MHDRFNRALPAALAVLLGLAVLLLPGQAPAQGAEAIAADEAGGALDTAVEALETVFRESAEALGNWARGILLMLLVLDLVWRGGKWVLSGQSFGDFAEQMVYTIAIVGLAFGFSLNAPAIVEEIANQAYDLSNMAVAGTGEELKASGIVDKGLQRTFDWLGSATWKDPTSWALVICAFIALIMMAAELTMLILVYAEMYLVGMVGIVTLAFAGLSQTRGIAQRYVMTMFAKGFKLMTLLLIANSAHNLAQVAAEAATPVVQTTDVTIQGVTVAEGVETNAEPRVPVSGAMAAVLLQMIGVALMLTFPGAVERLVGSSSTGDVAGTGAKMVAGAAASGLAAVGGAALGAAGGAVAGGAAAAKTAGAGAFTGGINWKALAEGGKAAAKGAVPGAARGGVNLGQMASERGAISKELGSRLRDAVNRPVAEPKGDSGAS